MDMMGSTIPSKPKTMSSSDISTPSPVRPGVASGSGEMGVDVTPLRKSGGSLSNPSSSPFYGGAAVDTGVGEEIVVVPSVTANAAMTNVTPPAASASQGVVTQGRRRAPSKLDGPLPKPILKKKPSSPMSPLSSIGSPLSDDGGKGATLKTPV
ncbi:hypothetical protein BC829DRAFT_408181 [Chytridium lagenaria]|nr:hypothetical protein BC829DRAFT_408181 [Chytridium lagenaria]